MSTSQVATTVSTTHHGLRREHRRAAKIAPVELPAASPGLPPTMRPQSYYDQLGLGLGRSPPPPSSPVVYQPRASRPHEWASFQGRVSGWQGAASPEMAASMPRPRESGSRRVIGADAPASGYRHGRASREPVAQTVPFAAPWIAPEQHRHQQENPAQAMPGRPQSQQDRPANAHPTSRKTAEERRKYNDMMADLRKRKELEDAKARADPRNYLIQAALHHGTIRVLESAPDAFVPASATANLRADPGTPVELHHPLLEAPALRTRELADEKSTWSDAGPEPDRLRDCARSEAQGSPPRGILKNASRYSGRRNSQPVEGAAAQPAAVPRVTSPISPQCTSSSKPLPPGSRGACLVSLEGPAQRATTPVYGKLKPEAIALEWPLTTTYRIDSVTGQARRRKGNNPFVHWDIRLDPHDPRNVTVAFERGPQNEMLEAHRGMNVSTHCVVMELVVACPLVGPITVRTGSALRVIDVYKAIYDAYRQPADHPDLRTEGSRRGVRERQGASGRRAGDGRQIGLRKIDMLDTGSRFEGLRQNKQNEWELLLSEV